jgi:hypothetical protein
MHSSCSFAPVRCGIEENALFEAARKEGAFLRLRNFGFPDYLRRASIRPMLDP